MSLVSVSSLTQIINVEWITLSLQHQTLTRRQEQSVLTQSALTQVEEGWNRRVIRVYLAGCQKPINNHLRAPAGLLRQSVRLVCDGSLVCADSHVIFISSFSISERTER